jgi:hypothetical protein
MKNHRACVLELPVTSLAAIFLSLFLLVPFGCSPEKENRAITPEQNVGSKSVAERAKPLEKRDLEWITPAEGFAYFSGNLNTNRDFPTIYLHGDTITIVAPAVWLDYQVSEIDIALRVFKAICTKRSQEYNEDWERMRFASAYLEAVVEREKTGGEVRLEDILKHTPKDQHEKTTLLFLEMKKEKKTRP